MLYFIFEIFIFHISYVHIYFSKVKQSQISLHPNQSHGNNYKQRIDLPAGTQNILPQTESSFRSGHGWINESMKWRHLCSWHEAAVVRHNVSHWLSKDDILWHAAWFTHLWKHSVFCIVITFFSLTCKWLLFISSFYKTNYDICMPNSKKQYKLNLYVCLTSLIDYLQ